MCCGVDADFAAILATLTDCEENIEEQCGLPLTRKGIIFLEFAKCSGSIFRNRTKSDVIETCSSASAKFISGLYQSTSTAKYEADNTNLNMKHLQIR